MAWNFDRVFRHTFTSNTNDILWDTRDVWVTSGKQVFVFGYFDSDTTYEQLYPPAGMLLDSSVITSTFELFLIATIDLTSSLPGSEIAFALAHNGDSVFVSNGIPGVTPYTEFTSTKLFKINIVSKTLTNTYNLPVTGHSYITAGHDRIWFTDQAAQDQIGTDRQKLYFFDTGSSTFSSGVEIPIRKQFRAYRLANGYNGHILLVNFNNTGIIKFNGDTGSFVTTHLTNRRPSAISVNSGKEVFLPGMNGMISVFNQTSNTITESNSSGGEANGVVDDGTYVWTVVPDFTFIQATVPVTAKGLFRTKKGSTTANLFVMKTGAENFVINNDKWLTSTDLKHITITQQFTYQFWNGVSFDTRTVKPYIFVLSNTTLHGFRNTSLYRQQFYMNRMAGLVSTGQEAYHGETE